MDNKIIMEKIGITIDSNGDLNENTIKENDISIIDFHIDFGEYESIEGNVFQKQRTGEKLGKTGGIKTSQPSLQKYLNAFKEKLIKYEEIIHISFSAKASGANNAATQAKKFLGKDGERIHILDSETGSGAQGLLVMEIIEDIKRKLNIEEIIKNFNKNIKNNFLIFTYDDPKWLFMGGRMPKILPYGLQKMKQMKIGMIMQVKDGTIKPFSIKRNFFELATPLFEEFSKRTKEFKGKIDVIISHGDNEPQANKLKELLGTLTNVRIISISLLDVVLGAHTGPNTLVLSWQQKEI
ncbi:MAG: DegV family protein [Candidatus Pacebacteria bacterium]|nr:DegV family protein [Candidatus Paceibacterota bacterium]